jgi:general stress protein YciG
MATNQNKDGISRRGFASMSEEKQREIASKGGKAAHMKGTAHEFTSDEAREAGRKGGQATQENRRQQKSPDTSKTDNEEYLENAA